MSNKKVLALQHVEIETPGIILDLMKSKGIEYDCINLSEHSNGYNLSSYDALIIMGGPMSVNDKEHYTFIETEINLVKNYIKNDKPILGICLGSQIIASALGGKISKNPRNELGWHNVTLSTSEGSLFNDVDKQFLAFHWHGDVFSLPNNCRKLAFSEMTESQAFNYGQKCYGLLFHLEITSDIVKNIVIKFKSDLITESLKDNDILENLEHNVELVNNTGRLVFNQWLSLI